MVTELAVRRSGAFEADRPFAGQTVAVERAESALFQIEQDILRSSGSPTLLVLADIGGMGTPIFAEHHPQVVVHAAAHKHVPMMESHPEEAIQNNLLATRRLGEISGQFGVEAFILISTDKAVRPTSVMGASKRMAEIVVQDLAFRYAGRFLAVRFGNAPDGRLGRPTFASRSGRARRSRIPRAVVMTSGAAQPQPSRCDGEAARSSSSTARADLNLDWRDHDHSPSLKPRVGIARTVRVKSSSRSSSCPARTSPRRVIRRSLSGS
jgi:hypothetical protein